MNTNAHQLQDMVQDTAAVYRLTPEDITGRRRDRLAFAARSEVIAKARSHGFSYVFLSQYFRRDHTSILNAMRHHEAQADLTPVFKSRRPPQ